MTPSHAPQSKQRLGKFHNAIHEIGCLFACGFNGFVMVVTQVSKVAEVLIESPLREIDCTCRF